AVRQVAVVVVDGAHGLPPRAGIAAVRGEGAAGGAGKGAGGGVAGEVPQAVEDRPGGARARVRQVAVGEVPDRLGGDVGLAVDLAAARSAAAAAVHLGEVGDGGRGVGDVLGPVDVAHAGAGGAGVAVAAAVGGAEAGADARVVELDGGRQVAVRLSGPPFGSRARAVVLVEPVAVFMERDRGDLAGVAAAAARAEEVERDAVPI